MSYKHDFVINNMSEHILDRPVPAQCDLSEILLIQFR